MRPLPKKCTGDDPLVDVINRIIDCIRERTPISGDNVKLDYLQAGVRIKSTASRNQQSGGDVWL